MATARKLVVIAWPMLAHNEPYRYALPRSTEAKFSTIKNRTHAILHHRLIPLATAES